MLNNCGGPCYSQFNSSGLSFFFVFFVVVFVMYFVSNVFYVFEVSIFDCPSFFCFCLLNHFWFTFIYCPQYTIIIFEMMDYRSSVNYIFIKYFICLSIIFVCNNDFVDCVLKLAARVY